MTMPMQYEPYPVAPQQRGSGLATAAFVLGIIAIVVSWVPALGFVLAVLAVVFGIVGLKSMSRTKPVIGVVLGGLALLINVTITAVALLSDSGSPKPAALAAAVTPSAKASSSAAPKTTAPTSAAPTSAAPAVTTVPSAVTPTTAALKAPVTQPAPPKPQTLLVFSGSGIKRSKKFTTGDDWTVKYTYDCSSFGFSGNFIVTTYTGGDDDFDGAEVDELGKRGSDSTPVFGDPGVHYLEVNSECKWTVKVVPGA